MCFLFYAKSLLLGDCDAPFQGNALHSFQCFFEKIPGADEREPEEILAFRAKCRSGNRGDPCFFQQDFLDLLGARSSVFDIDPGIKSAVWRLATEAVDFVQAGDEQIATLS